MVKAYRAGSELLGLADALRNKHLIEARDRSDHAAMIEDSKSDKRAFLARWRAICKPNSLVEDLILDFPSHENNTIEFGRTDCQFVIAQCKEAGFDFDRNDVQDQIFEWRKEFLEAFKDTTENGKHKQRAKFCELFSLNFFHPFLQGLLLSEDLSDCDPKLLFASQPYPSCCGTLTEKGGEWGCEKCEPHHAMTYFNILRIHKNVFRHPILENQSVDREKIFKNFFAMKSNLPDPTILIRLFAVVFHIAGMSPSLWKGDEKPTTAEQIWTKYPLDTPIERQRARVERLRRNREGWGNENYVDENRLRRDEFKRMFQMSPSITIHGEGGLGKTELLYQTLHEFVSDDKTEFRFDYLMPYTFKGPKQGEFSLHTESGRTEEAYTEGWSTGLSVQTLIQDLARERFGGDAEGVDLTELDTAIEHAAEFLIENKVWLIVDNHEIVDKEGKELDKLLDKFYEKLDNMGGVQKSQSRVIITTRVKPDETTRKGLIFPIPPLSYSEMATLARKRIEFERKTGINPILPARERNILGLVGIASDNIWKSLEDDLRIKLNSDRMKKTAGHPIVVFIVVYEFLYEKDHLGEEIDSLFFNLVQSYISPNKKDVKSRRMKNLLAYMLSYQLGYLTNLDERAGPYHRLTEFDEFNNKQANELFPKDWEEARADLLNKEFIVAKVNSDDSMLYQWRTNEHGNSLKEHLERKYPKLRYDLSQWKWWDDRISKINTDSRLSKESLDMIGVPKESSSSNRKKKKTNAMAQLKLHDKGKTYSHQDAQKIVAILTHFGNLYVAIKKTEQYPLAKPNQSQDMKDGLIDFLLEVFNHGISGLNYYFSTLDGTEGNKKSTLDVGLLSDLVFFFNSSAKHLQELAAIDEQKGRANDPSGLHQQLSTLFTSMIQYLPIYTSGWASYNLLRKLCAYFTTPHDSFYLYFRMVGLYSVEFDLSVFNHIRDLMSGDDDFSWSGRKFRQAELIEFGKILTTQENYVRDERIQKFMVKLSNHIETSEQDLEGLFKPRKITIQSANSSRRNTISGTDLEEDSWKIYNSSSEYTDASDELDQLLEGFFDTKHQHELTCLPINKTIYDEAGNSVTYALHIETHNVVQIKSDLKRTRTENVRPIVDVPKNEMTEILAGIYFDVDVPAPTLFGDLLKSELQKRGIESTGKVWREWRDQHYPSQNLSDLIEDLFNGNWKVVFLDHRNTNAIIRKIPQVDDLPACKNCGDSNDIEVLESEEEYDTTTGETREFYIALKCTYCEHRINDTGECISEDCKACLGIPRCPQCYSRQDVAEREEDSGHVSLLAYPYECTDCELAIDDGGNTLSFDHMPVCMTCGDSDDVQISDTYYAGENDYPLREFICNYCEHNIDRDGSCRKKVDIGHCFGCESHHTVCFICKEDNTTRDFENRTLLCKTCNHYLDHKTGIPLD